MVTPTLEPAEQHAAEVFHGAPLKAEGTERLRCFAEGRLWRNAKADGEVAGGTPLHYLPPRLSARLGGQLAPINLIVPPHRHQTVIG